MVYFQGTDNNLEGQQRRFRPVTHWQQHHQIDALCYLRRMGLVSRHRQQALESLQRRNPAIAARKQYHRFLSSGGRAIGIFPGHRQQALRQMATDGSSQNNLGSNTTAATPAPTATAVFFEGTDHTLWRFNLNSVSGGCSLNLGETQEQRRTQVASHEFLEMISDPDVPTGWYGNSSDEIGDTCNGQTNHHYSRRKYLGMSKPFTAGPMTSGRMVPPFASSSAPSPIPGQYKIGLNTTSSTPFVGPDGLIYFRGTDTSCGSAIPVGPGNGTLATTPPSRHPPCYLRWLWLQGTDNKL